MNIQQNISLKNYNTFGIDVYAKYFTQFISIDELKEAIEFKKPSTTNQQLSTLVLGGGSNILFTQNFDGLVLKNEIKGIEVVNEDDEFVYVKAGAGENWHQFVLYCIENNFCGVENLSLIPGNVGASPMQNIGAYGVEIKDVFYSLEAFHIQEKKLITFNIYDCAFGYRESVFKNKFRNQFIITSVTYKLKKRPTFNTSYGAIEHELEKMGITQLSIKAISDAVINIRTSKLPNPKEIGNAGSFFKNPEISSHKFHEITQIFPNIVGYNLPTGNVKLAAGWLIEQCGWKGFRNGDVGCHAKQALVLVNYGNAKGKDIYDLSTQIINSVNQKFGVELEREVNII
ncbi:MAG: UDP-N-acetylmuramate dehydrogenase [Ferruginibacter sp.]|nr:UDP-N-acetylmuramate dehydrogenase [Ferruginibacter sp.]